MNPPPTPSSAEPDRPVPSSSPNRTVAIAVDLSDESAYAVRWAVQNYLRPGDAVVLLHVRPTSVLYGADWGSLEESQRKRREDDLDAFTAAKAAELAAPLVEGAIPYGVHIVRDHDMKERLCLEVERLGLGAVIMGSRGSGAARPAKGRLGSVSDYCVHHCVCPVVVVRLPDEEKDCGKGQAVVQQVELHPVPEEEEEEEEDEAEEQLYHDAADEHKDD